MKQLCAKKMRRIEFGGCHPTSLSYIPAGKSH